MSKAPSTTIRSRGIAFTAQFGLLIVFGFLIILFTTQSSFFFTADTLRTIINIEIAPMLIFAMGLTVVLVMGDFDLSFAATGGLAAYTIAAMVINHDFHWTVGVILALITGVVVGIINGYLVAYRNTSSFVITLAMSTLLFGFEQIWSDQKVIQGIENQYFLNLNSISGLWNIRVGVFIAFLVIVGTWILLDKTELGRFMYAVGGNQEAARLAGINVKKLRLIGFVVVAILSVLVGTLGVAQSGTSIPRQFDGLLLPAYAAVFLGTSVFKPGKFNVGGTVVGCLFLRTIKVGLLSWGLDTAWINITQGLILVLAVLLGKLVQSKS